jgi:hypothetical protein
MSTLRCEDNAPDGYRNLDDAHTLFASSTKKADPTKRGRFNAGEKFVLVMCGCGQPVRNHGHYISGHNQFNRNQNGGRKPMAPKGPVRKYQEEANVIPYRRRSA